MNNAKLEQFLAELTKLTLTHGIIITLDHDYGICLEDYPETCFGKYEIDFSKYSGWSTLRWKNGKGPGKT